MAESTVLNLVLWLPVLGMVALLLAPRGTGRTVRGFTFGVMLLQLALAAWLGRLPGGLLHTNIGCSALFAATSGSSVATAATRSTRPGEVRPEIWLLPSRS